MKKRLRITGWDHIHSKDHRKRNRINKNFNVRIQIWIFQRTKNGYLTVIRTVRIRYLSWNGSEHSFGIVGSYRSRRYAWIVPQRKTHGEPSSYVKSPIRIRGAIFSMLRLKRYCGKVDTNNWLGPRSFERSSKTEPDEQKNWNENSNLNLPTNKKTVIYRLFVPLGSVTHDETDLSTVLESLGHVGHMGMLG